MAARGELRPGLDSAALARVIVAGFHGVQHVSGTSSEDGVAARVAELWDVALAGIVPLKS